MKKTYFASDFHLGINTDGGTSEVRERKIVRWLEEIADSAESIYLLGDIFDFWFEYKTVIPKGYSRILGTIAKLRDRGIPIYFFTGNHDMWMFRYMEDEFGIPIIRKPIIKKIGNKTFLLGHGDGLGPGDKKYKIIKRFFDSKLCQWLFARIHPNLGIGIANLWSKKSRESHTGENTFVGADKEWLIQYCENYIQQNESPDYFLFGHRHLPIDYILSDGKTRYLNIGDWKKYFSFATFDGEDLSLHFFENIENFQAITNH